MTPYKKHWKEMEEYCKRKIKEFKKAGDDVMANLYHRQAKDAIYMQEHEREFSEDIKE